MQGGPIKMEGPIEMALNITCTGEFKFSKRIYNSIKGTYSPSDRT